MKLVLAKPENLRPFLEDNEAENNMFLGSLQSMTEQSFLVHLEMDAKIQLACLYTGKYAMLAGLRSGFEAALPPLIQAIPLELPGVIGPAHLTQPFAQLYSQQRGCKAVLAADQRIYSLTQVNWPAVPGSMRKVQPTDHELLAQWLEDFHHQALAFEPFDREATRRNSWKRIREQNTYLWECSGRPVALAGLARPTARGICINAVYTPPPERGHGFASALVAAVSAEGLARGKSFCMLYTDLSNPTSNKIYQRLGYQPVCDACTYLFQS